MTATPALPAGFVIVRIRLKDGSWHEATWTGEVWWTRRGALIPQERVEDWGFEPVEPSATECDPSWR